MKKTLRESLTAYLANLNDRAAAVELLLEADRAPIAEAARPRPKRRVPENYKKFDGKACLTLKDLDRVLRNRENGHTMTQKIAIMFSKTREAMTVGEVRRALKISKTSKQYRSVPSACRALASYGFLKSVGRGQFKRAAA